MHEAAFKAAIACPHEINDRRVVLEFDATKPGHNALNQLHLRLMAALAAPDAAPAIELVEVPHEPCSKLLALADKIDPEELWRRSPFDRESMTEDQRDRLDASVSLRRYADLLGAGGWRIYPPKPGLSFRASTLNAVVAMAHRDEARRATPGARAGDGNAWTGVSLAERLDILMHATQWDKDEVAFLKANLIRDIERWRAAVPAVSAPLAPLTDEQIDAVATQAVKDGMPWLGFKKDANGEYRIPVLSAGHYALIRAVERARGIASPVTAQGEQP